MLSDLSENAALTLTFNSVNCKHLCHKCLIGGSELNDITLNSSQLILRTPENMRDSVNRGVANQHSLHNMPNIFWKYL